MNNQQIFLIIIESNEIVTANYIEKFFQDLVNDNNEKISIDDFHIDKVEGYVSFSMTVVSEKSTNEKILVSIWEDFCSRVNKKFYNENIYNTKCNIEKEEDDIDRYYITFEKE